MCPLSSCATDQSNAEPASSNTPPDRRSGWSIQHADDDLAALLLAFFRKRLRAAPDSVSRLDQARLLARRTLDRLAHQHADEPPSGSAPQKEDVMRAALMELRRLDAPVPLRADDSRPIIRRN